MNHSSPRSSYSKLRKYQAFGTMISAVLHVAAFALILYPAAKYLTPSSAGLPTAPIEQVIETQVIDQGQLDAALRAKEERIAQEIQREEEKRQKELAEQKKQEAEKKKKQEQEKLRLAKEKQKKAKQEQLAKEKAAKEKAAADQAIKDKMKEAKEAKEKAAAERAAKDKTAKEKAAKNQAIKAAADKANAAKAAAAKAAEGKAAAAKNAAEKAAQDAHNAELLQAFAMGLSNQVLRYWTPQAAFLGLEATVAFHLDEKGQLRGQPKITKSSGNSLFDREVINSIVKAAPLQMPIDKTVRDLVVKEGFKFTFVPQ